MLTDYFHAMQIRQEEEGKEAGGQGGGRDRHQNYFK